MKPLSVRNFHGKRKDTLSSFREVYKDFCKTTSIHVQKKIQSVRKRTLHAPPVELHTHPAGIVKQLLQSHPDTEDHILILNTHQSELFPLSQLVISIQSFSRELSRTTFLTNSERIKYFCTRDAHITYRNISRIMRVMYVLNTII